MKYKTWVDRIENEIVILDFEGSMLNIPIEMIPDAKEGDCIILELEKNIDERKKRETEIKELMDELWEK